MLGGGLVFIYDLIPLIAAYLFSRKLPKQFARATMNLSEKKVKIISLTGIFILRGHGALSFSDIDRSGWLLVLIYILLVVMYISYRAPFNKIAEQQRENN